MLIVDDNDVEEAQKIKKKKKRNREKNASRWKNAVKKKRHSYLGETKSKGKKKV